MPLQENDFKWKDDKESVMLLKQKICRTHDLILQYSSKVKENSHIKSDLTIAKKEAKRMIYNYKSALDKIKELELKVTQVKQINEKLTNQMNEHNADTTADKQTIQQFICKMKELEEKHSVKIMEYDLQKFSFEEKIKILEQELKKSELKLKKMKKKTIDTDINISKQDIETKSTANINDKKNVFNTSYNDVLNFQPIVETQDKSIMTDDSTPVDVKLVSNIDTNWVKSTSDIGINTISNMCEVNFQSKFEMQDKNIMTDEFYNTANNPLPLFCAKCETHLPLDLLPEQIYKTMCIYPKLIKEDQGTIPKKNSSLSCSLLDTYPDFINKEVISSNELCESHLNSNKQYNNPITINETTPSIIQNSENVENDTTVSQTNVMTTAPTNLSNDLNFISVINLPEPENANCTKKSLYTNDLIQQSSFIKEIEKKLELLESKMKKFLKLKKKQNIYSCHYCKDKDISLNSDLLTAFFKSVQYYNDKREKNASFRDEQNELRRNKHDLRMKKKLKKRKRLKKYNKYKNSFLWKIEHLDENFSRNIFYRFENAKATNVLRFDYNTSCITTYDTNTNMNNLLDINTVNQPLDNKSDKESILFMKDNQIVTDTTPILSNSQNSINHINNKVITKSEMKKENFKKDNRLLKNIKNLKRLMQTNSQINKEENSILCSDHNVEHDELIKSRVEREKSGNYSLKNISNLKRKLEDPANSSINIQKNVELYSNSHGSMKKMLIAHVPKSSVLQSNIIQKDFIHHTVKNVAVAETFQQKYDENQGLDEQIQGNGSSIENEKSHTMKKNKKNIDFNEMHNINNEFEENSIDNGDYLNNSNSFPFKMNVAQASVSLGLDKCDNVSIDISDTNAEKNCDDYTISRNTILNDDRLSLLNRSNALDMSGYENHDMFITTSKCQYLPIVKNNEDIENCVVQIPRKKINTNKQQEIMKCINVSHDNKELRTPISYLIKYVNKKSTTCQVSHKMIYISTMTDKFIRKQLQRFADNVWEDTIYHEVIQNLTNTCGSRIIAKCIIEFLLQNANDNVLDKSFTPPAPLMTTFEQNLIALLIDLEVLKPGVIHFIQIGIQYKLFKLNNDIKNLNEVDTLTRIYVVLSRIQKDREKIRIMCCDALYCMGLKSISLLYIILTCWPEVLPNAEINIGILPKCIAFLIGWQQINNKRKTSLSRLRALKSLIMSFYKYSYSQETINDLVKEFIANLKVKQTDGLHTAIILIAKKEGPSWTYKNIINSTLLPMIINHEYPCIYNGFSLLGRLLRAFPLKSKIVQDITEQLHDLIKSGQGSHDQQEGIISALLSLSRHNFDIVALSVLRWMPNTSLKSTTIMQLEAFIKMYKTNLWELFKTNMY